VLLPPFLSTVQAFSNEIFKEQRLTIGLDLRDRWSFYCVLDEAGKIILEQKVATTPEAMKELRAWIRIHPQLPDIWLRLELFFDQFVDQLAYRIIVLKIYVTSDMTESAHLVHDGHDWETVYAVSGECFV
jgi:hypothetical protein